MSQQKCSRCDEYKSQGHNYCRMCGFHLTKGYVQYARVAVAYRSDEKFCGYCGEARDRCACGR